jgi:hypothetical protein
VVDQMEGMPLPGCTHTLQDPIHKGRTPRCPPSHNEFRTMSSLESDCKIVLELHCGSSCAFQSRNAMAAVVVAAVRWAMVVQKVVEVVLEAEVVKGRVGLGTVVVAVCGHCRPRSPLPTRRKQAPHWSA